VGITRAILIAMLGYCARLSNADNRTPRSNDTLVVRRSRLMGEVIVLSVMSVAKLLTCVGFSI